MASGVTLETQREYGALWQEERRGSPSSRFDDPDCRNHSGREEHVQQCSKGQEDRSAEWPCLRARLASWASNQRHLVQARSLAVENRGLLLIMISQMFFASMNLAVKLLNSLDTPVPTLELIFVRMGGTLVCSVIYTVYTRVPDPLLGPKALRPLLIARGMFGFLFLFPNYWALKYLSLSDDTSLSFLSPLVTAIFARLFLKETYSMKQAFAALCSLFGVILVARPPFLFARLGADKINVSSSLSENHVTSAQRFAAVGAALLSVLGGSMAQISMRAIGKRSHAMHMMNYFSLWCVLTAGPGMALLKTEPVFPRRWESGGMLIMMSIFGFLAQILLTMGLQRETATRGSMGVYVQVIFAAAFEFIFFGTVPSPLTIVGAGIIIACAVYVVLSKRPRTDVTKVREPAVEEGSLDRPRTDETRRLLSS